MYKFIQKTLLFCTLLVGLCSVGLAENVVLDELKGLQRNPKADRISDGAHDQFQNVYINYGNLEVVKGRKKINTTAHSDIVVNGLWYYENQAGTTKKIIVAESDEIVSYALDGTGRTSLVSGLSNVKWDAVQIGDTLYLTSTNGLYKWTGSGSATLITGVSAPSSLTFSASSNTGAMTSGLDGVLACCSIATFGTATLSSTTACGTVQYEPYGTANYQYKITSYNSITGIESESSTSTSVGLNGNTTATYRCNTGDLSGAITYTGAKTSTTTTMLSSPSTPFNGYCIYRTVASGTDYFKVGCITDGFSSTYNDGKPDSALATALDTTIDTITPPSYRYIEEYKGSIFVAQNDTIKFSRLPTSIITDADKYWLDSDELQITGNISSLIKASDSLLILTKTSIYQLTGYGVTSFRLVPIIQGVGTISDETVEVDNNGDVLFFSGTDGVYRLTVGQQPTDSLSGATIDRKNAALVKLSSPNMDNVFRGVDNQIDLDPADYATSHAYLDKDNDLYFLYIGEHCFIFNERDSSWSYVPASQFNASIYTKQANEQGQAILLDNVGFFYNNWQGYENGVESGTVTGHSTSSTNNTLSCTSCSFNTTNDGLKGAWIFIDNDSQEFRQISSNTGTQITVSSDWTNNPIPDDTFYIGYINTKWRTKQYSVVKVPQETFTTRFYINHNKSASTQLVKISSLQKKSNIAVNDPEVDFSQNFVDTLNTRMRSSWVQWDFESHVYNTSTTVDSPIDIISYIIDAEQRESVD